MKWKDVVAGDILPADRRFKPVGRRIWPRPIYR